MTLKAIKQKYGKKMMRMGKGDERPKPFFGNTKISVEYKHSTLALNKKGEILNNHLLVAIEMSSFFEARRWNEGEGGRLFDELYQAMIEYWKEYAAAKGLQGVVVVGGGGCGNEFSFKGNTDSIEDTYLSHVASKHKLVMQSPYYSQEKLEPAAFKGAFISEDLKGFFGRVGEVIQVLECVMQVEKMFSIKNHNDYDLKDLTRMKVPFLYAGEELLISVPFPSDEESVVIKTAHKEEVVNVSKKEILAKLLETEKEMALANLVENPMDNYMAFITEAAGRSMGFVGVGDEVWVREFDVLCESIGGWKSVEEEFAELRKVELKEVISCKNEADKRGINVVKGETKKHSFYFIDFREQVGDRVEFENFIKTAADDEQKEKVEKLVSDLMFKGVL